MKSNIVIFGASGGALKVIKTLKNLNIQINFLTDNNSNLWGKKIENIPVIEPDQLKNINCRIIIASDYQEEIELQLENMGLIDRLILKEQYILKYLNTHELEIKEFVTKEQCLVHDKSNNSKRVLIDLLECTEYGGIEIWSYLVAEGLIERGYDLKILGDVEKIGLPKQLERHLQQIDVSYEHYYQSVLEIMKKIYAQAPCTIIINRQGQSFIAAYMLKQIYPNLIKIISVIHTDRINLYRRQAYMQTMTDAIAGVSKTITHRLLEEFKVAENKIYFKESPVIYSSNFIKKYSESCEPIKIGYAARITKTQKRADLLPKLLEALEQDNINYNMSIAGEGTYLPTLNKYIEESKCKEHVVTYGQIERSQMNLFWEKQDIFISLSEFEGTSLSMLEAMSYGVVPIVTQVSGVEDIINNGRSGFICKQHDVESIKNYIKLLCLDRNKLRTIGAETRNEIISKCNREEYIDYIIKLME